MEKLTMPFDYATPGRKAFVKRVANTEGERIKNRAAIAADNQNFLKLNWFANAMKATFRGLA